jgi:hypothetical protein
MWFSSPDQEKPMTVLLQTPGILNPLALSVSSRFFPETMLLELVLPLQIQTGS